MRDQKFRVFFCVPGRLRSETEDLFPGLFGFFRVCFFKFESKVAQDQRLAGVELFKRALDGSQGFLRLTCRLVQERDFSQFSDFFKRRGASVFFSSWGLWRNCSQKTGCQVFNKFRALHGLQLLEAFALEVQGRIAKYVGQEFEAVVFNCGRAVHKVQN